MREVEQLFEAEAASLFGTMANKGVVGFKIPDYQRAYDWDEQKICRLLEDTLNGLYDLQTSAESYTFLGSLILVKGTNVEPEFNGISLDIVDGQQRLTTLTLICSALAIHLQEEWIQLELENDRLKLWLEAEVEFQIGVLYRCVVGEIPGRKANTSFPRLIRHTDHRGVADKEYQSLLSRFLLAFCNYYENEQQTLDLPSYDQSKGDEKRFIRNFEYIKHQLAFIRSGRSDHADYDAEFVEPHAFKRKNIFQLFDKLDVYDDDAERNKALAEVSRGGGYSGLCRLLLFSSYLTNCLVLTRVETEDENSAFDIFDALNTTGEPLTAIETFSPRVIQFENTHDGFRNSESEILLNDLQETLNRTSSKSEDIQKEAKEAVIAFALLFDGTKGSLDLSSQRRYLRNNFDSIGQSNHKRNFVRLLAKTVEFRFMHWRPRGIQELSAVYPYEVASDIQLLFKFVKDINTRMVLPPALRFWISYKAEDLSDQEYVEAVKAIVAFVVFRRAVTGSTDGIDSDLRALMQKPLAGTAELCVKPDFSGSLCSVDDFRSKLQELLRKKTSVVDRDSWIVAARNTPVGEKSRGIARFLLLAAATHSLPDHNETGLRTREDVRKSNEQKYLTYENWVTDLYKTVEHVAPVNGDRSEWDSKIYSNQYTKHTLGNLTLLPQKENSSASNKGWKVKRIFFKAVTERDLKEQRKLIEQAKDIGFDFPKKTKQLLDQGERLHLLEELPSVDKWNCAFIEQRTDNILGLAWDKLSTWLFRS